MGSAEAVHEGQEHFALRPYRGDPGGGAEAVASLPKEKKSEKNDFRRGIFRGKILRT